jgi:preprotein translocase subunit YajC
MLVTPAFAQSVGATPDMLISILPFVLIFVIMYFHPAPAASASEEAHGDAIAIRRGDTDTGGGTNKGHRWSTTMNSRSISAAARK